MSNVIVLPTYRSNWTIRGVHDIVILIRFNVEAPPRTAIGADGLTGHGRVGSQSSRYLLFMPRSGGDRSLDCADAVCRSFTDGWFAAATVEDGVLKACRVGAEVE